VPHPHQNNTFILSYSTHDNSTTMAPIDKAIANLKSYEQDKDFSIRGIAKKHGFEYSTLRRRWTGQTGPSGSRVTWTSARRTDRRGARPTSKTPDAPQTLTRDNSTTMAPIDDAIAAIESREHGEHFSYQAIVDEFGVQRSTLPKRPRKPTSSFSAHNRSYHL
jgi:hypothetical protein